jgi:hypothetical protein
VQHGGGVSAQSLHSVPEPPQATAPSVNQPQHGPGFILNQPKIHQYLSWEPISRETNIKGTQYPGDPISREPNIQGTQYPREPIPKGTNTQEN